MVDTNDLANLINVWKGDMMFKLEILNTLERQKVHDLEGIRKLRTQILTLQECIDDLKSTIY